jgi:hypothetical protein
MQCTESLRVAVAVCVLAVPAAAHATTERVHTTVADAARAKGSFKLIGHSPLNAA